MKILLLASWYPSSKNPIAGIFVKEQVKAIKSIGLNPIVFYPYDNSIEENSLLESIEDDILVYRANTDYLSNSKLSKINSFKKCNDKLEYIVKKHNIDLIHAHVAYTGGISAYFYYEKFGIPYILTEHRSNIAEFSQFYNKFLIKKAYKNAKCVICVSQFLLKDIKSLGYDFKGKVIGNVVNVTRDINTIMDDEKCISSKRIKMLWIGRIEGRDIKGLNYLLPALKEFIDKYGENNIELTLVGDGPRKDFYINMAKELGISNVCNFIGAVKKEEIPKYIKECSFLVVSSVKETFGSVIIESMALGKPVLSTACGGPNEIINDTNGILVPIESSTQISYGIKTMINKLDDFNSKEIIKYAEENYSYRAIGQKLNEIYRDVLESRI